MRTVFKYGMELRQGSRFVLTMPKDARIVHVACQGHSYDQVFLWAVVNPDLHAGMPDERVFHVFGTGQDIPDALARNYVGTAVSATGMYVWHVFEQTNKNGE